MSVDQRVVDQMSVCHMSVGQMFVGQRALDQITVGHMSVGEVSFGQMAFDQKTLQPTDAFSNEWTISLCHKTFFSSCHRRSDKIS
jgi:hypothetical protein